MPREGGPTRARLLDAALDAFARAGFAGASIRAITGAVGIRESAFYAHFRSKQAIYDELLSEAGPAVIARLSAEVPGDDPAEVLVRLAEGAVTAWSSPRARSFASVVLRDAFGNDSPDKRAPLLAGIEEALRALGARFARWQQAGSVRADAAPEMLAFEFVAPIVMTRFLFLNAGASAAEMERGRRFALDHVATFTGLLRYPEPRPGSA